MSVLATFVVVLEGGKQASLGDLFGGAGPLDLGGFFFFGFLEISLALIAKQMMHFPFLSLITSSLLLTNQSPIIFSSFVASAPSTAGFTSPLGFVGRIFCSFPMNRRWKSS